jgi:hypothetical protein
VEIADYFGVLSHPLLHLTYRPPHKPVIARHSAGFCPCGWAGRSIKNVVKPGHYHYPWDLEPEHEKPNRIQAKD